MHLFSPVYYAISDNYLTTFRRTHIIKFQITFKKPGFTKSGCYYYQETFLLVYLKDFSSSLSGGKRGTRTPLLQGQYDNLCSDEIYSLAPLSSHFKIVRSLGLEPRQSALKVLCNSHFAMNAFTIINLLNLLLGDLQLIYNHILVFYMQKIYLSFLVHLM